MYSLMLHGRRSLGLQKWRHLIVSVQKVSAFSNFYSSASVVADVSSEEDGGRKGHNFAISYLVDSLGFSTKLAESISKKVSFVNKGNPDSVLNLFRSHGFTNSQICNIVRDYPQLLVADAEKSIGPKLEFLKSREGVSSSELIEILSKVPKILGKDRVMSIYYDFIKEIIVADKSSKFGKLCHSSFPQEGSRQENIMRNVSVLRELGVPQESLFSLLTADSNIVGGKERFEETLKKVVEMGFDPTTPKFVKAFRVVYQMSEKTVEEKLGMYKRLGFDGEDVWGIFKKWPTFLTYSETKVENSIETFLSLGFSRDEFVMMVKLYPSCIGYSIETVKKKTEFLVKKMNWPLKAMVSNPVVFGLSMEKRILPRCNVIKALMSKGLLGGNEIPPILSVFACTDDAFLNRYVKKHKDEDLVAELTAIFRE